MTNDSSSHQPSLVDQMARMMGVMTETAVAGQSAGLQALAAEMQALTLIMPGLGAGASHPTDAEVEASFDNLPV